MPRILPQSTRCLCGHSLRLHEGEVEHASCVIATCYCTSFASPASDAYGRPAAGTRSEQVGGDHYAKHKIQPWDIWEEYGLNAFEGAVLKYLLRRKGDRLEDLKKARHTLDRLIEIEGQRGAE